MNNQRLRGAKERALKKGMAEMKIFLTILIGLVAGTATAAAPLEPVTVVTLAARHSQAAVQATSDSLAAAADVQRARSTWYPVINVQGQYTARDNQPEIAAGPFVFPMGNQSNGEYQVSAKELLWSGGRRNLAITAAQQNLAAARAAGMSKIQSAQLAALQNYAVALGIIRQGVVLDQRLKALRSHQQTVQDLYDQGVVARNDLLETEVRVLQVQDARTALDDRLAVVKQDLNRILGRDIGTRVVLPDSLPPLPLTQLDQDSLVAAMHRDNPTMIAARHQEQTTETLASLARRAWWPSVFASASHGWQQNDALVHPYVNAVAVGVSWDVFDGGARKAEVTRADARNLAAQRGRLETERSLAVALDNARRQWREARREEVTARHNVVSAAENLRIVEDQYRNGLARSSDVLDAETLLADSRLQGVLKHHQAFLAQARMAAVAGRDLVDFYTTGEQGSVTR